jgi:hypothetical protein
VSACRCFHIFCQLTTGCFRNSDVMGRSHGSTWLCAKDFTLTRSSEFLKDPWYKTEFGVIYSEVVETGGVLAHI